ncbi:L-threonylcarbamoyladenylate synthase [Pollutibacter soli]|uniref:L-threonylcarbamoyladenylate synthase n=1 Tax=Pollutibacter soli TaxID=3034157 RepID=UPI00301405E4
MQTEIGHDIHKAIEFLKAGDVVAIPTETVYGLAGNALNEEAIVRIFEAKQRPRFNPLIVHVASFDQVINFVQDIPVDCTKLAEKFSPGPISFLLNKKDIIPDLVTAGSPKVAIRIPSHPVTLEILKHTGFPLAAPSANPFGYVSPVSAEHVFAGLHDVIPYILDGGPCQVGLESTIVGFEEENITVYRLGGVTTEEIQQVTGKQVNLQLNHEQPDTPGQLKSHYAPNLPLWVGDVDSLMQVHTGKRIAVIAFKKKYVYPEPAFQFTLSPEGDLQEAARNLFRVLREADALDADIILAERFPESGLGRAINDRLTRASFIDR